MKHGWHWDKHIWKLKTEVCYIITQQPQSQWGQDWNVALKYFWQNFSLLVCKRSCHHCRCRLSESIFHLNESFENLRSSPVSERHRSCYIVYLFILLILQRLLQLNDTIIKCAGFHNWTQLAQPGWNNHTQTVLHEFFSLVLLRWTS